MRALEQVLAWLRQQGASRVRLAVAEQNEGALHFWLRHGFRLDRRFPPRTLSARETVLLELTPEI